MARLHTTDSPAGRTHRARRARETDDGKLVVITHLWVIVDPSIAIETGAHICGREPDRRLPADADITIIAHGTIGTLFPCKLHGIPMDRA